MKKIIISIVFLVSILSINASACISQNGSLKLKSLKHTCLHVNGKTELSEVTITEETNINGILKAYKSTFNNVKVNGFVKFYENSKINGDIKITGRLFMSDSRIENRLNITSEIIEIANNSYVNNIYVKSNGGKNREEIISIDNSIVDGNIEFESEQGKVTLKNGAKVNGTIIGGKIVTN